MIMKHRYTRPRLIGTLLCLSLFLTGCSTSLKKPELTPTYELPQAATFLRGSTLPGLMEYLNFPELVAAKANGDPNLEGIEELPRLMTVPDGFFPVFNAGPGEALVSYSDAQDAERKFVIYGTVSEDPARLLEDFSEEAFFTKETIGEADFYILTVEDPAADLEAYTIRGSWFLHMTGYGMEDAEFKETLGFLELSPLVPDTP